MNIILDTNAFIYFFKICKGIEVPSKWKEKQFDKTKYIECLANCDKIIITSETLHELFLQSLRQDETLDLFLEQYSMINDINKGRFKVFKEMNKAKDGHLKVFNDKDIMYFDLGYLVTGVNNRRLNINEFLQTKVNGEKTYIKKFIKVLMVSVFGVFHKINGDKVIEEIYQQYLTVCDEYIEQKLSIIYRKCYIERSIDNKKFENELDILLKQVFEIIFECLNMQNSLLEDDRVFYEEIKSKECLGVNYLANVFNKLSSTNKVKCKDIFIEELKSTIDFLIDKMDESTMCIIESNFIQYILEKYISDKRALKKNDIIDCLIISCLDTNVDLIIDGDINIQEDNAPRQENTCVITFDKMLFNFSKEYQWMYNEEVYNEFFI